MNAPQPPHDAQREMEQRALRNVRGLVDKVEAMEKVDARSQKRMLIGIVIVALVVLVVVVGVGIVGQKSERGTPIQINPSTPSPNTPAK